MACVRCDCIARTSQNHWITIRWTLEIDAYHTLPMNWFSDYFSYRDEQWQMKSYYDEKDGIRLMLYRRYGSSGIGAVPFSVIAYLEGADSATQRTTQVGECRKYLIYHLPSSEVRHLRMICPPFDFRIDLKEGKSDRTDEKATQTASYMSTNPHLASFLDQTKMHATDVVFHCKDQVIKAHKVILCVKSPVFARMLDGKLLESRTGVVAITDMTPDLLYQFLRYLYSGALTELTVDSAKGLYEAGDKYEVDGLALRCAEFLKDNLTQQNACEMLVLADAHSDDAFAKVVIDYIVKEKILLGERWVEFSKTHPSLAVAAMNRICRLQMEK